MVRRRQKSRGFTLIELMIVISVIMILMSVSIPKYTRAVQTARENTLRQNLFHLRQAIDMYTQDKQKAPQSLEDLVSAGYFRQLPKDPITNSSTTWQPVSEDVLTSIDQQEPGITDVHSGAQGNGLDGTPYSEW
jgi:general secretion pathway protein G